MRKLQKMQKVQKVAEDGDDNDDDDDVNNAWTLDITRLGLGREGGVRAK